MNMGAESLGVEGEAAVPLPTLECDIVMRGGVTSGVVYPGAVFEIASHYRLRSIGGTSAGAIAAAVTAAMELGRTTGLNPNALAIIEALPGKLGTQTDSKRPFLFHLFAPDPKTKPLFDLLIGLKKRAIWSVLCAATELIGWQVGPSLFAGFALIGVIAILVGLSPWAFAAVTLFGGLGIGILFAIAAVIAARGWSRVAQLVRDNHFGLCSGVTRSRQTVAGPSGDRHPVPALTEWLHDTIQEVAGLPPDRPLTFGDLWTADHRNVENSREDAIRSATVGGGNLTEIRRQIDLVLIATDLSRCLSLRFPFIDRPIRLYVRRSDLERLFPAHVVEWMSKHRAPEHGDVDISPYTEDEMFPLPRPEDLPVIFAARTSMSFPLLFSAIRLYVPRFTGTGKQRIGDLFEIWLSDGGITSNFPVHLFDGPIPTRPTFCLNLVYPGETLEEQPVPGRSPLDEEPEESDLRGLRRNGGTAEEEFVYMPDRNEDGISQYAQLWDGPLSGLATFIGRIPYVARLWADSELMTMPGQRDRIAHIRMRDGEGGFNLDMSDETIESLDRRGRWAGRVIAERFLPGQAKDPISGRPLRLNWANHRFTRLRSALAGLEVTLSQFSSALRADARTQTPKLVRMISPSRSRSPLSQHVGYKLASPGHERFVLREVLRLHYLAKKWSKRRAAGKLTFDSAKGRGSSPRPKQLYRLRGSASEDPAQRLPPVR